MTHLLDIVKAELCFGAMKSGMALKNNLMLVIHNTRDFGSVDGLHMEDWEVEV